MRNSKAFTLIELLVVMAIMAIIMAISFLSYKSYRSTVYTQIFNTIRADLKTARSNAQWHNKISGFIVFTRPGHKETLLQFFEQKNYDFASDICYVRKIGDPQVIQSDIAIVGIGDNETFETSNNPRFVLFNEKAELTFRGNLSPDPTEGNPDWNLQVTDHSIPGFMIYNRDEFNAQSFPTVLDKDRWLVSHAIVASVNINTGDATVENR